MMLEKPNKDKNICYLYLVFPTSNCMHVIVYLEVQNINTKIVVSKTKSFLLTAFVPITKKCPFSVNYSLIYSVTFHQFMICFHFK